jgi:general secretion pathway protein J
MAARQKGAQSGFTLLELLVALTILSLIALVMLGGLKFGARAWDRVEVTSDDADSVDAAQTYLRRQLAAIYPLWLANPSSPGRVDFAGEPDHLVYLAPPPAQFGPADLSQFQLQRAASGALNLSWRSQSGAGAPSEATLLHGIASLQFAYFGPQPGTRTERWTDRWADRARLPSLIRIQVTFPSGDRRVWPEFVVHPEIMVDVSCVYDPISHGCRGHSE